MKEFEIMVDSSCDLPEQIISEYNIYMVPFSVSFEKEQYLKEREEISSLEFFSRLSREEIFPKTLPPDGLEYYKKFIKIAKENKDIICICITDKFSKSYQSALSAKAMVEKEYTDCKITVINSILATAAEGLLVIQAAKMKQLNMSHDEIVDKLEKLKSTSKIMITISSLEYLQRGGRIGKARALLGNLLNRKPLIMLDYGELQPYGSIGGSKRSYKKIIEMTQEYFEENKENFDDYEFVVTTGIDYKEAEYIRDRLKAFARNTYDRIFQIGVTIGAYSGPEVVCISFIKKYDRI